MNHWKKIWDSREDHLELLDATDTKAVFAELKRVDGFDLEGGLPLSSLLAQYEGMKMELGVHEGGTAFEVGCGAGANLYLLAQEGVRVGGLDYSDTLLAILKKAIPDRLLIECVCDEARNLPTEMRYDVVFSNSVFAYFDEKSYARDVLALMADKARKRIGVLDVYDEAKKEECLAYRRRSIENYEERYKNLPKMFYSKSFFRSFAEQHSMKVWFKDNEMKGYGNAPFTYHCYMEHV